LIHSLKKGKEKLAIFNSSAPGLSAKKMRGGRGGGEMRGTA